ncbi:MAG: MBOAT family protein [Endomicrobiales bacterium]|nr:MBOAT family protein [Endomicrobiales bacterium]
MLLVASYIFYGAWNWKFLSLILISTILDYFCGIIIYESNDVRRRKLFLFFSVAGNITILGFFKYFNFFVSNLQTLLNTFSISLQPHFIHIILPVGISFYTFQTMSYTIDIYYKKLEPTRKFFDFALFVAFFPQLVAGPIERAKNLLPQILAPRKLTLDKFREGIHLIFWGLFQKMFIADNLAKLVDPVFASGPPYIGTKVLLALYAFAFQIFCDFAGYSNIARGLAKCMGIELMVNFNLPYFATNPSDFWNRWHISLSSWLRDYLYIPLGGNRHGSISTYKNLALTMLLGGLWHGAAWTFIIWGIYQGTLLIVHRLVKDILNKIFSFQNLYVNKLWFLIRVIVFFQFVCIGWLIFRGQSVSQIIYMFYSIFSNFHFVKGIGLWQMFSSIIFFIALLLVVQVMQFLKDDLLILYRNNFILKSIVYFLMFYLILLFGVTHGKEFIYFQF